MIVYLNFFKIFCIRISLTIKIVNILSIFVVANSKANRKKGNFMKAKKLISLLLALVMIVSCASVSFVTMAEENYKPAYTDKVTEEDVKALIGDVNTILEDKVLTGDTIESIYKMLPKLKSLLMLEASSAKASDKGLFYKLSQPERFAELPEGQIIDDVYDENGKLVTEGTFTAFFKENPIVCKNAADFKAEIDIIAKTVLVDNIMQTLVVLPMFIGDYNVAPEFGTGIDEVCKALGIEQEKSAAAVLGFNAFVTGEQYDIEAANKYIQNITAALFPDTANSVIDMLQNVLQPENAKLLYSGLSKVINNLDKIVTGLSSTLSGMGVDIASVQTAIADVKAAFSALPTTGEGADKQLDIQGVVGYFISNLTDNAVGIKFGSNAAPSATVVLEFTEMQLDRVANAQSNADAVKIVYDYLYNNLIGNNKTNSLLNVAISTGIIENALGITFDDATRGFITDALYMSNDELADELIVMVAGVAGREIPSETPDVDPENPDNGDDDSDKPGTVNPFKPGVSDNDNVTDTDDSGRKVVKKANIPNTGIM